MFEVGKAYVIGERLVQHTHTTLDGDLLTLYHFTSPYPEFSGYTVPERNVNVVREATYEDLWKVPVEKLSTAPFKFSGMFELGNNYLIFNDVCQYGGETKNGYWFTDSNGVVFDLHPYYAHLPKTVGTFEKGKSYKVDGQIVQYIGVGKTTRDEWCHNFVSQTELGETTIGVLLAHRSKVDVVYGTCFVDLTPLGNFHWSLLLDSALETEGQSRGDWAVEQNFKLLEGEQITLFRNYLAAVAFDFAHKSELETLQVYFVQEMALRVKEFSPSGFLFDVSRDSGIFVRDGVWYFEIL